MRFDLLFGSIAFVLAIPSLLILVGDPIGQVIGCRGAFIGSGVTCIIGILAPVYEWLQVIATIGLFFSAVLIPATHVMVVLAVIGLYLRRHIRDRVWYAAALLAAVALLVQLIVVSAPGLVFFR